MNDLPEWVVLGLAGVLAAVANVALHDSAVLLPHVAGGKVKLGFLAQVLLCVGVAYAVDHNFRTAFLSALCGNATLREVKRRMDAAFERLVGELDEPE
jgi:hypothetical protein